MILILRSDLHTRKSGHFTEAGRQCFRSLPMPGAENLRGCVGTRGPLDPAGFRAAADTLRTLAREVGGEWAMGLRNHVEFLSRAEKSLAPINPATHRNLQDMEFLVTCVMFSGGLQDSSAFLDALRLALRVCLPPSAAESVEQFVRARQDTQKLPSATTLYRHRSTLTWGSVLLLREKHDQMIAEGGLVRYTMIDSSPQGHYDYLLSCHRTLAASAIVGLFEAALLLASPHTEEKQREECILQLRDALQLQTGCPSAVGSGRASTAHKVHAFCHATRMETSSWSAASTILSHTIALTTDLGVEYNVASIEPFHLTHIIPWARDEEATLILNS